MLDMVTTRFCSHLSTLLLPAAAMVAFACGPAGGDGASSDASGQGGSDGGGATADARVVSDAASCGAQTEEIPLVELGDPPDLLIVLDKSGSMSTPIDLLDFFGPTKWDVMEDALANITNSYDMNIRFGLTAFPNDNDICGVTSGADVDVNIGNATAINSWMGNHSPDGNTPAHLSLQNASSIYAALPVNSAGQYVLFATDGEPNCGGNPAVPDTGSATETVAAVQALNTQGIGTFVLGFGNVFGFAGVLNDAAQAGGHPQPNGPPYYYAADDAASLQAALMAIAGGIVVPTCSFAVTETPPDPDLVTVTIEGTPIPRDPGHNNGWDYHPDANTITFFGAACDAVQQGQTSVSFVFGCPGPVVD